MKSSTVTSMHADHDPSDAAQVRVGTTKLPKAITDLSTAIAVKKDEIQKLRDDADRCRVAADAGRRSMDLLEQLRGKRAEIEANAFVEKTAANTDDIDAEILRVEQSHSASLAQARAARLALIMIEGEPEEARPAPESPKASRTFTAPQANVTRLGLQPNLVTQPGLVNRLVGEEPVEIVSDPEPEEPKSKLGMAQRDLAALEDRRRALVLAWLLARREKAIDLYIKAIQDLAPIIGEAVAADRARARFGEYNRADGIWVFNELRRVEFPIPHFRMVPSTVPSNPHRSSPITWSRNPAHGDSELEQILAELNAAGVVA
jgi:hypothetical protein